MATSIHESNIKIKNGSKLLIDEEFHKRISEKYNSGLTISISKKGYVLFGKNCNNDFMEENFHTETEIKNISKVLLAVSKEYKISFVGTFNYSTYCGFNGNVKGVFFIDNDRVIYYEFHIDELKNKEENTDFAFDCTPHTTIVIL
jgi:hypothetical protein